MASVGLSTREESVEQRRGGRREVEETYLDILNDKNAWLLDDSLNLPPAPGVSHFVHSALEATSVSRTGKKERGPFTWVGKLRIRGRFQCPGRDGMHS